MPLVKIDQKLDVNATIEATVDYFLTYASRRVWCSVALGVARAVGTAHPTKERALEPTQKKKGRNCAPCILAFPLEKSPTVQP